MMTPANHQALVDRFVRLEDLRLRAYDDATGKELRPGDTLKGNLTIGIGRNLTGRGISSSEAMVCFEHDLADVFTDLEKFPWWGPLDVVRQMAVADVRFNLGPAGFRSFRKFLRCMAAQQYTAASLELLNSALITQEPVRVRENAAMIRTGILPARK
jgi:lysozyme